MVTNIFTSNLEKISMKKCRYEILTELAWRKIDLGKSIKVEVMWNDVIE